MWLMMRHVLSGSIGVTVILGLSWMPFGASAPPESPAKEQPPASFAKDVLPFLTKHCYACHGNGKTRGDVALDKFQDDETIQKDRKVWDTVLKMIRTGEMPPKEKPRPGTGETEAVVRSIDGVLARIDCSGPRNVGRVTIRRLNRTEYNNTIRDLVGIDFKPAADFPNDDVGYGFDNIGDVLSMSPLLLEKYLAAAESVLDECLTIPVASPPARSKLNGINVTMGAGENRRRAGLMLHSRGEVFGFHNFEEGDYTVLARAYGQQAGDEPVRAVLRVGGKDIKEFEVKGTDAEPTIVEAKMHLKSGAARVAVAFLNPLETSRPEVPNKDAGPDDQKKAPKVDGKDNPQRLLFVRGLEVDGPYNAATPPLPEAYKRLMARGDNLPPREAAREIVTRFANRAFRRPVKVDEVERFLKLYDNAGKEGERFDRSVRLALCGVLVSSHFLFRVELDPPDVKPGTSYPVGEYELASRLSYFLWSTMPDDELIRLAARGQLRQNLEAQVRRMVKDRKSAAFVESFAGQWLTLRKLELAAPDPKIFPDFDEELRRAMHRETELFFDAIVREDRSMLDLLDADFSFVNERLAKHYGIEGVKGNEFQRVKLPADRGGILTQASILTLTSNATRTAPVKRGKWVLDQILNTPPPPPPPDVPELKEEKQLTGSLRKVMEMHRENALCASCHQRMDPIGFAFENYDAIGAWRSKDGKFDIDASGELPNGQTFTGPAELKIILKGRKDLFCRCLTEKMLTYALGRGLEHYDRCAVDKLVAELDRNDYRFSTLLLEVVKSEPFQMRMATGGKQ